MAEQISPSMNSCILHFVVDEAGTEMESLFETIASEREGFMSIWELMEGGRDTAQPLCTPLRIKTKGNSIYVFF